MAVGRRLSESELFLVQNMREQARVRGEIIWLESRNRRAYKTPAAIQRLTDLKVELSDLQAAVDQYKQIGQASA